MATELEEAIECLEAAGYCDDPKDMLEEVRFASAWTSNDPNDYTPSPIADMRVNYCAAKDCAASSFTEPCSAKFCQEDGNPC